MAGQPNAEAKGLACQVRAGDNKRLDDVEFLRQHCKIDIVLLEHTRSTLTSTHDWSIFVSCHSLH